MNWIKANLTIVGIIVVLVLCFALLLSVKSCSERGQREAQAKQDVKSADAYAGAAQEAVATVTSRAKADTDVDAIVAAATLEIDNAENPVAARAAVISAVCGLQSYRYRPECKMLPTNSGNVAEAR
jgi:Na+-transporting methylmalonyl-CoA/oxaloacetate decarboxylase gamma subunit